MKDLQQSNKMSIYSEIVLHMPFPAMISLLVLISILPVRTICGTTWLFKPMPTELYQNLSPSKQSWTRGHYKPDFRLYTWQEIIKIMQQHLRRFVKSWTFVHWLLRGSFQQAFRPSILSPILNKIVLFWKGLSALARSCCYLQYRLYCLALGQYQQECTAHLT